MNKTKIDWADSSWNPVTGCYHDCEYCYAKGIARRFEGFEPRMGGEEIPDGKGTYPKSIYNSTHGEKTHIFNRQPMRRTKSWNWQKASYPYGFEPTFHKHKLNEYANKKGRTIFVCSMADLFGEFIPDEWIKEVFKACAEAPQHRYLFLTKNPKRYKQFDRYMPPNMWFGWSQTKPGEVSNFDTHHSWQIFASFEPLLEPLPIFYPNGIGWVIIGAETGKRKDKVIPKREWVENIARECRDAGIPVFMKESLHELMSGDFTQEFPWKVGDVK